jgi:hypothetical protein
LKDHLPVSELSGADLSHDLVTQPHDPLSLSIITAKSVPHGILQCHLILSIFQTNDTGVGFPP